MTNILSLRRVWANTKVSGRMVLSNDNLYHFNRRSSCGILFANQGINWICIVSRSSPYAGSTLLGGGWNE